eukprot:evm.model.NODE_10616_length_1232_cov_18.279221.2
MQASLPPSLPACNRRVPLSSNTTRDASKLSPNKRMFLSMTNEEEDEDEDEDEDGREGGRAMSSSGQ